MSDLPRRIGDAIEDGRAAREETQGPGGYVVVLFGHEAEGWCSLNKCPMGSVRWFSEKHEAHRYADTMPEGFEPHILRVDTDGAW